MTVSSHRLELLSPARDAAIAREAILHGADAVYIGGPGFGARHNASNSLKDIAELVPFAHRYGAKIFVTLNTILHDDELEPAQRLITDLYQTGVDALIVQDMGILELDIPPIELHASTQCDIRTVEKAKFLSDVGFTQIVLARELNLEQIRAIHQATDATIEFFIHGALCVAYSGQCYISHAQTGRSANRGDCSQACRLPYTLKDDQGRVVSYEKHLLSMKDNDQTANLGALIDAGVRSFKIEGRYKDMSYVKNITAHYRQMLDAIIEERGDLTRASSGRTEHFFVPSTEKTFHRGSTDYFVNARKGDIGAFDSPKFIGLPVGEVLKVAKDHLDVAVTEPLANGDGLNVMIKREVVGFRANTVEKTGENQYRVWPNEMPAELHKIRPHHPLNRNLDHNWQQALTKTSSERRVAVDIEPGDWVIVENPCFYGALQALERLRLKALSVATDVKEGIDLKALELALQEYPVKACWLMTNSQNPLGFTLTPQKKARLVALLNQYNVTLIEDDVYSELYFGREKPLPAKAWDRHDGVLHCSSFSKCLVPGFRIGWVAAGKHARKIQRLQLMSTLSTSSPMQLALVDYLSTRRYDAHLRRLRRQLAERKQRAWQALLRYLPAEVKIHHNDSGYFLWLELPEPLDAGELSLAALTHHISIAPGKMFSTGENWSRFFRFNTAWQWGEREEQAVKQLGKLIQERL